MFNRADEEKDNVMEDFQVKRKQAFFNFMNNRFPQQAWTHELLKRGMELFNQDIKDRLNTIKTRQPLGPLTGNGASTNSATLTTATASNSGLSGFSNLAISTPTNVTPRSSTNMTASASSGDLELERSGSSISSCSSASENPNTFVMPPRNLLPSFSVFGPNNNSTNTNGSSNTSSPQNSFTH